MKTSKSQPGWDSLTPHQKLTRLAQVEGEIGRLRFRVLEHEKLFAELGRALKTTQAMQSRIRANQARKKKTPSHKGKKA